MPEALRSVNFGLRADEETPVAFSESLKDRLEKAGKAVEYYSYPGADHNISGPSLNLVAQRVR